MTLGEEAPDVGQSGRSEKAIVFAWIGSMTKLKSDTVERARGPKTESRGHKRNTTAVSHGSGWKAQKKDLLGAMREVAMVFLGLKSLEHQEIYFLRFHAKPRGA